MQFLLASFIDHKVFGDRRISPSKKDRSDRYSNFVQVISSETQRLWPEQDNICY
jgi:hypothetical protein